MVDLSAMACYYRRVRGHAWSEFKLHALTTQGLAAGIVMSLVTSGVAWTIANKSQRAGLSAWLFVFAGIIVLAVCFVVAGIWQLLKAPFRLDECKDNTIALLRESHERAQHEIESVRREPVSDTHDKQLKLIAGKVDIAVSNNQSAVYDEPFLEESFRLHFAALALDVDIWNKAVAEAQEAPRRFCQRLAQQASDLGLSGSHFNVPDILKHIGNVTLARSLQDLTASPFQFAWSMNQLYPEDPTMLVFLRIGSGGHALITLDSIEDDMGKYTSAVEDLFWAAQTWDETKAVREALMARDVLQGPTRGRLSLVVHTPRHIGRCNLCAPELSELNQGNDVTP